MDKKQDRPVLVIEDEADIRSFFARVLELEGYRVFEASDGAAGMEIVRQNEVALVLLDLKLPGMDGWTILREIKRDPALSAVPVLVITAVAEMSQLRRTLRMGAAAYLIKPLSARSLSQAVAGAMSQYITSRKAPVSGRLRPGKTPGKNLEPAPPSPIAV